MADRQFVERNLVEGLIAAAFDRVTSSATPRRLRAAMHHAVFSGGGRLRPRLALKTAEAWGDAAPEAARTAAVANCDALFPRAAEPLASASLTA